MPAGPGKFSVMMAVQEIFGAHEHIKDMCRRYAKMGCFAIAPEMFARQGDVSRMTDMPAILSQVVSKVLDAQVCADLDTTLAFARATGQADAKRTGLVGYCWGGRTAWVYARHNGNLNAAVAYYCLLEGLKTPELRPQDPIDFADEIRVPMLGLYSGIDAFVKQETIAKMRGLINKGGSGSEIVVFPNVDHGFNADYRPTYDKVAATYAQKLAGDWFKKYRAGRQDAQPRRRQCINARTRQVNIVAVPLRLAPTCLEGRSAGSFKVARSGQRMSPQGRKPLSTL